MNKVLLVVFLLMPIALLAQEETTLKGKITDVTWLGSAFGYEITLENYDGGEQNIFRIEKGSNIKKYIDMGIDLRTVGKVDIKVKKLGGIRHEFVSWGPLFNKKVNKSVASRKKAKGGKGRMIASLLKKHKSSGPNQEFLKSEFQTQDSNYKTVSIAAVELYEFYRVLNANPKWEKNGKAWILKAKVNDKVTGKHFTVAWQFTSKGKGKIEPNRLSVSGTDKTMFIHNFLEQPAAAIRKLREKS